MKKLLLMLFLAFSCNVTHGQALLMILFGDKLSTEKFQAGINASVSASSIMGLRDTRFYYSWAFGAFGEIRFSDTWFLHFDLTIKTPGGARDVQPFKPFEPIVDSLFKDLNVNRNFNYITLPVLATYRAGAWKFGVGGQIGYLTSATDVYSGSTILGDEFTMDRSVVGYFNRWDAGLAATVEYSLAPELEMRSMRISLKYYYGLTDVLKDNDGDAWTNSILLLSFGIPIGGSDDSEKENSD